MPKIFLLKNKLHQQQQKLMENQKGNAQISADPLVLSLQNYQDRYHGQLLSPPPPPLPKFQSPVEQKSPVPKTPQEQNIPEKDPSAEENDDRINGFEQELLTRSVSPIHRVDAAVSIEQPVPIICPPPPDWNPPPKRRFLSTLGGDQIPYGSKNSLLITPQSDMPVVKIEGEVETSSVVERELQPPTAPPLAPKCIQVSVIQRSPAAVISLTEEPEKILIRPQISVQEPEQDAPIDYHVPKKKFDSDVDIVQSIKHKFSDTLRGQLTSTPSSIITAATGWSSSGQQGSWGGGGGGGSGGGGGNTNSGSHHCTSLHSYIFGGGGGGEGGVGGGGVAGLSGSSNIGGGMAPGGGGMNPGGNGNLHFGGPVSLPPFHDRLIKFSGNNYSFSQYDDQHHLIMTDKIYYNNDTGQNLTIDSGPSSVNLDDPFKQYSSQQNTSSLVINIFEDDREYLSGFVNEPNGFNTLMAGQINGKSNDSLRFTAPLTFTGPTDTELMYRFNDASELFLKQPPNWVPPTLGIQHLQMFKEPRISFPKPQTEVRDYLPQYNINNNNTNNNNNNNGQPVAYNQYNYGSYDMSENQQSNDSFEDSNQQMQQLQIQVQLQPPNPQNVMSCGKNMSSLGSSSLEMDSNTSMSVPSPSSVSMNGTMSSLTSSPQNRKDSSNSGLEVKDLQHKLSLPNDFSFEFINGGYGIKNPLANHDVLPPITTLTRAPEPKENHALSVPPALVSVNSTSEPIETNMEGSNFCCDFCSKTFSKQRLLNRHMKCHNDVKRYLCTFCMKGFNDKFDLKRHTRTHTGVRPYNCNLCKKSFTQRCSLESHCLKVHRIHHQYAFKERRSKMYVCEECGCTSNEPEVYYMHLKEKHPYSPALLKFYDKRHFNFTNTNFEYTMGQ